MLVLGARAGEWWWIVIGVAALGVGAVFFCGS
jgi:hypothetical protein